MAKSLEKKTAVIKIPQYRVMLLNDDTHSYEYVIQLLHEIFGFDENIAFQMAKSVDRDGRVAVYEGPLEHAEFKQLQIEAFGADPGIPASQGPMTTELEAIK